MRLHYLFLALTLLFYGCGSSNDDNDVYQSIPNLKERYKPGGETTIQESGFFSFNNPAPNLSASDLETHLRGDALFEETFVASPSEKNQGLGIQYNNTSCENCHPKDGRSAFPKPINSFSGFFLRASLPGKNSNGGAIPVPGFGDQLQNHAILGHKPEVQFSVKYEAIPISFADGTKVILKKPIYSVYDTYIPMPENTLFSPRIAPPIFGLGLLEAIKEEDILAQEDEFDRNKDGISGKANWVWDVETNTTRLGRFGWKANTPSIKMQVAGAYHADMGITSVLFPKDSDFMQPNGSQNSDDDPEISEETLNDVTFYNRTLAVPAARNLEDRDVIRGYYLFEDAKCSSCHTPRYQTGTFLGIPAISNQVIYPYTDMLLHDMGENLADNRPDYLANGNEWKTRPLWGIGLTKIANGHTDFLHDGRAHSIEEAILWHGGEAKNAQQYYTNLSKKDRDALIKFIESL